MGINIGLLSGREKQDWVWLLGRADLYLTSAKEKMWQMLSLFLLGSSIMGDFSELSNAFLMNIYYSEI